jgi:hypothetical protein
VWSQPGRPSREVRTLIRNSKDEKQLILLSAGTAERRRDMHDRAGRLAAGVDWGRLAETLRMRRLLPTLGPRVVELADGRASDDFSEAVEQAIAVGRRHGSFLQLVSVRAIAMLADAGIPAVALKGPVLGEAIYGDPGRRPASDIDLLVAPEQLQKAVEVIRSLSYLAPPDHVYDDGLPLLHFVLVHERGELPPVELHWRVHWYERRFAHERLLPPSVDDLGSWRPAPADELAALLLFYARDGFVDLRLATDLGAWWDVYGAEVSTAALREILDSYPELERVVPAALKVAERLVGLPAASPLVEQPRLGLRGRMAVGLANPHPRASAPQLYADIGLIDGLLAPRGGFGAFVRRQLFPPPEVLDQQARHAARRRARSPLGRSAGVLGRYGLTVTRLVRARETLR